MSEPLWAPSPAQIAGCNLTRFMAQVNAETGHAFADYAELHAWSVRESADFWSLLWTFSDVVGERGDAPYLLDGDRLPGARWFPRARLNYAENCLRRRDDGVALIFRGEAKVKRSVRFDELYDQVSRVRQALVSAGIRTGDRVAGYVPNLPESIVAMLAATSLGAIWSSCSPDFGVQGVVDRFGQIEPKLLFIAEGYFYDGKRFDSVQRLAPLLEQLPSVTKAVVIPYTADVPQVLPEKAVSMDAFVAAFEPAEITFERFEFDHPLYVMYSSGTTGVPKCIVHGAGGTLLKHLSEQQLHTDLRTDDRLLYFTTCGWMMWNWLVSGLASGATLLLYDGSPFHPGPSAVFDFADEVGMTVFGTSAKYIDAVKKSGLRPIDAHDLSSVRTILSTGSPLSPESYDFVYDGIKRDVCLSSITGGTDILGCFALGNPMLPVWRGEIQCKAMGLAVDVFDDDGHSIRGEKGELVCTRPFPSTPVGFWNDPQDAKYRAAYFDRYPNVWHHGDYVELTEHDGLIMHGRSDAVLNPGGVRIGTAEIYRQVEQLEEVVEGLVIGQQWEGDTRVVLFVRLREGLSLDEDLVNKIKAQVRTRATPRHVPSRVVQVTDIPRTKSGKIVELAVRNVVHGEAVKNKEALANPEALELFANCPTLQS